MDQPSQLPQHIQDAIDNIAAMHVSHHAEATPMERLTDRATAILGTPSSLLVIGLLATTCVAAGFWLPGYWFDPPPFHYLDLLISLVAILFAVVILASQRREDRLANRREQMVLQLVFLTEQKMSKRIDLMEELRRDLPNVHDRVDLEAIEMTGKPDHAALLGEIQDRSQPSGPSKSPDK